MPKIGMPGRADIQAYFVEKPTLDHTRETPQKQSNELQILTNQGGRLSTPYESPYLDRITLFRFDKLDASHPPDTYELTEHRVYDDTIRHFHTMASSHQTYDVADIMNPADNLKIAFYRKSIPTPHGPAIRSIAALRKGIKDANGREPEISPTAIGIDALDNVTNRPLNLTTAREFPVESLLRNLSEKHGRVTVVHVDQYKTDGTPIENECAKAHAFDFSPPPAYQEAHQRYMLDQFVAPNNQEDSPAITGQSAVNGVSMQGRTVSVQLPPQTEGLWPVFGLSHNSNDPKTGQTNLLQTQFQRMAQRLPALEQTMKRNRSHADMEAEGLKAEDID